MKRTSPVITLIPSTRTFYTNLIADLSTAKKEVSMLYYAYCYGRVAEQINNVLISLVKRKVRVHLGVSSIGAIFEDSTHAIKTLRMYDELRHEGIDVQMSRDICPFQALHAKLCAIDDKIFFFGGSNIADHYQLWTDTNFRLSRCPSIVSIHDYVFRLMNTGQTYQIPLRLGPMVYFNIQYPCRRRAFEEQLLHLIQKTHQSLNIVAWYFAPTHKITHALIEAMNRGVNLSIMYSQSNRFPPLSLPRAFTISLLKKRGATIIPWTQHYNHSKLYWNETTAIVGSPNIDFYSLWFAQESFLVAQQKQLIRQLNNLCRKFLS